MSDYKHDFNNRYTLENNALNKRYAKTLSFLDKHVASGKRILDLGIPNQLGELMSERGHTLTNTEFGQDLDLDFEIVKDSNYDVVTAFEIFEHMVAPFNLLREIKAPVLVASIPLKLWFSNAYWNEDDKWDRHYHEFEPRQFDMLLEKSGWKIVESEQWTSSGGSFGIRPLLRKITPRYYIVYCVRA